MTEQVTSEMTRLPELAAPASLAAQVMARIARLPGEGSPVSRAEVSSEGRHAWAERLAWTCGLAGLVIVFATYVYSLLASGSLPDLTSLRIGSAQLSAMPVEVSAMPLLALGLLMYLAALFSPLRRGR